MDAVSTSQSANLSNPSRQARYWIATVARNTWEPCLPRGAQWLRGQLERAASGFEHYQFVVSFPQKKTLGQVKSSMGLPQGHFEPTRSSAAELYCVKDDTRIGEPFEFGQRSFKRNDSTDWDRVRVLALAGELEQIPSEIFIRYYSSLQRISSDYLQPVAVVRTVHCFWGPTSTGKSHRAWAEAGNGAYSKDPRSKFWCGYVGQRNVVLDEFRGAIDVSHLLRWLDKYPVYVEIKGSSRPLVAEKIWITSNLHPSDWYPLLDKETYLALDRRLIVTHFNKPLISK